MRSAVLLSHFSGEMSQRWIDLELEMQTVLITRLGFCSFVCFWSESVLWLISLESSVHTYRVSFLTCRLPCHLVFSSKLSSEPLIYFQESVSALLFSSSLPERSCIPYELIFLLCFHQQAQTPSRKTQWARKTQFLVNFFFIPIYLF